MMKISPEGIALIKKFEGCELNSYQCSANVWTIGYGHTKEVEENNSCSLEEAEEILVADLEEFEEWVEKLVTVEMAQNEFDALVAWTFNLGPTNLRTSTLLERLNDRKFEDVPFEMKRWNRAGGVVVDGLVRRREAEALLFKGEAWENV
jgi:lysozyme